MNFRGKIAIFKRSYCNWIVYSFTENVQTKIFVLQDIKTESPSKISVKKETNQWYDVGIIKGTSCIVSHYHLPSEAGQGNGDVSVCTPNVLICVVSKVNLDLVATSPFVCMHPWDVFWQSMFWWQSQLMTSNELLTYQKTLFDTFVGKLHFTTCG